MPMCTITYRTSSHTAYIHVHVPTATVLYVYTYIIYTVSKQLCTHSGAPFEKSRNYIVTREAQRL